MAGRASVRIEPFDGQIGTFHADSPCSPTGVDYTRYVGSREKGNREIRNQRKEAAGREPKPDPRLQEVRGQEEPDTGSGKNRGAQREKSEGRQEEGSRNLGNPPEPERPGRPGGRRSRRKRRSRRRRGELSTNQLSAAWTAYRVKRHGFCVGAGKRTECYGGRASVNGRLVRRRFESLRAGRAGPMTYRQVQDAV